MMDLRLSSIYVFVDMSIGPPALKALHGQCLDVALVFLALGSVAWFIYLFADAF